MNENKKEYSFDYGGKNVVIETGRLAKQADGSVLISCNSILDHRFELLYPSQRKILIDPFVLYIERCFFLSFSQGVAQFEWHTVQQVDQRRRNPWGEEH